ncbi:hypothetical protein ACFSQ7_02360 [Paenibacillus rhizoplanae]
MLMYLLFSVLSFAVIIISVNKAIDYFSFVTIEKQMMEKADLGEMSFREVLSRHEQEVDAGQMEAVARSALETLKASVKEVRIYDSSQKLLGLAVDGIVINNKTPVIFFPGISRKLSRVIMLTRSPRITCCTSRFRSKTNIIRTAMCTSSWRMSLISIR